MNEHPDAFPETCMWTVALTDRARRTLAALRDDGIDARPVADRFPAFVNRLADAWEAPTAMLPMLSEMLVEGAGESRRLPPEAIVAILAMRRHAVRRIVVDAGLQAARPAGLSRGRCTPSSPS